MPLESKRIATLLLMEPDAATWRRAIEIENILQKDTIGTAVRQSNLIRKRLATLDVTAWKLITEQQQLSKTSCWEISCEMSTPVANNEWNLISV